jgi:CDP-paratose 2-epimerase
MEAFARAEKLTGKKMLSTYVDKNREGDHICYISDLAKMRSHYPSWDLTKNLDDIFSEIVQAWKAR